MPHLAEVSWWWGGEKNHIGSGGAEFWPTPGILQTPILIPSLETPCQLRRTGTLALGSIAVSQELRPAISSELTSWGSWSEQERVWH